MNSRQQQSSAGSSLPCARQAIFTLYLHTQWVRGGEGFSSAPRSPHTAAGVWHEKQECVLPHPSSSSQQLTLLPEAEDTAVEHQQVTSVHAAEHTAIKHQRATSLHATEHTQGDAGISALCPRCSTATSVGFKSRLSAKYPRHL